MFFGLSIHHLGFAPTVFRFLGGAFLWTLLEYFLHRFSFHASWRWAPGKAVHLDHHAHAASPDHIGAPVILSLPIYGGLMGIFAVVTGHVQWGYAFSAGLALAYLGYERLHLWLHHGNPRGPWGRFLRKYHMDHHFKDSRRAFGVTSPFWDGVFGTLPKKRT